MGRRSAGPKVKKRKKVTVRIISEKHNGEVTEPHRLLAETRKNFHAHLEAAKIGLAWRMGWKSDTDGHMTMGQCRKSSDLDREMYKGFDFVILLNEEAWPRLNEKQKRALIDHELCHAAITMDADGNPKFNDRDRLCCRVKKHDIDEFKCIVERHGLYTQDLEDIARAAINDAKRPLLKEAEKAEEEAAEKPAAASATESTESTNGESQPPAGAWKRWKVDCLSRFELGNQGLPDGKVKLLQEAGLTTMGKLVTAMRKEGGEDFWWKSIRNFGESGYDALTTAMVALRAAKPEFQADEA